MTVSALDKIWQHGFKAGELLMKECPYKKDTPEARNWVDGWNEGFAKALGFPYSVNYEDKLEGIKCHSLGSDALFF